MKNRFGKIALLGFCVFGLAACGRKQGDYDMGTFANSDVNAILALYDYLPAQDVVIPMDSENQANKYIADIVDVYYVKNAVKVIKDDQVYVVVSLSGENAVELEPAVDIFEKDSKETAASTEKP